MKEQNDNFEQQWREQFEDAEKAPAASVWDKIDADLAGGLVAHYKKKLFYYKIAVAASILLALLFGSYSLYTVIRDSGSSQMVQNSPEGVDETTIRQGTQGLSDQKTDSNTSGTLNQENISQQDIEPSNDRTTESNSTRTTEMKVENSSHLKEIEDNRRSIKDKDESILTTDLTVKQAGITDDKTETKFFHYAYQLSARFNVPYENPGRKYTLEKKVNPYDQPIILSLEDEEKEIDPKKLWAGVSVSSGIFDPNINYGSNNNLTPDAAVNTFGSVERIYSTSSDIQEQSNSIMSYKPEESSYKPNISISYGLDFGYRFSKRFVILSGMDYQQNYGSTTVNTYVEPTETHTKYANHAIVIEKASPESGLNTYNELGSEVILNSTFEFVTIPVNIGYYLIDRKFKWMMTAGLTTDVFIQNSISDSDNLFDKIQYKTGESSPYNPLYFNGKFGTMFHYTFLGNYQISLEPSYRIGLSSLTKENASFSSRPSSFIISAGIAYVF